MFEEREVMAGPPGWPRQVPPPHVPGWEGPASAWLLDYCPADYRAYGSWRRYPVVLAWVTTHHIDAQLVALRQAYRQARLEFGEELGAGPLHEVLTDLETEGVRLRAARRGAGLVLDALRGAVYIPRL